MHLHEERLPHEEDSTPSVEINFENAEIETKTVRLTLTSHHDIPELAPRNMSMFLDGYDDDDEYTSDDEYDDDDDDDDAAEDDNFGKRLPDVDESELDKDVLDELLKRIDEYIESLPDEEEEKEDENTFVLKTLGKMRRTRDSAGHEVIEIEYAEDESMDDTATTLVYSPTQNDLISIHHGGSVMSCLVCERGVRHISTYVTPIMPFELAIYTRNCDIDLTFEHGGFIELDYLVEMRGMDMQRTKMSVDVVCLD